MERIFNGTDKIILDSGTGGSGVVPYLPLNELRRTPAPQTQSGGSR
jgi:membrane protease subunit HflK